MVPAWLHTCLKQCLATERHHKVLRRLLHLLAAIPSNPPFLETGSRPKSSDTDSSRPHKEVNAQQRPTDNDAHTIASSAAPPETPNTANQVSDAAAGLPILSAPAAPCSSSSSPITTTSSSSTFGTQLSAAAPTAAPCAAATVTAAVQQYEQISYVLTQARHPSVKREGLRCLGAAAHSVIAALMPSQAQRHPRQQPQQHSQQDSRRNCHQQPQAAVACISGDKPSGSQQLSQDLTARELAQNAADMARHEQAGTGNSGSEEAQLRSSLLHEAEPGDLHSRSGSGSVPAQVRDSPTSQNSPQTSGRAQFEHGASKAQQAQQAQHEGEQTAYDLVDGFVDLVSTYSKAQQFDDMRLAAATALAASGSHTACPPMIAWCMLVCPSTIA